jgi:hypothetical protein
MSTTSYASWVTLYLATKLNPAGTLTVTTNPWPSNWRLYLVNDNQVEWIDYTSVTASWSNYILWWLTRDLSPTTIPATSLSTWKTWLATQKCLLVAMHDQLWDRQQGWPFASLTTAQLTARTNKLVWETFFNTILWSLVYWNGSSYQSFWTWTFVNASTTNTWWVELATQWEVDAWTPTWSVWPLIVWPDTYIANRNAYITSLIPSQAEAEAWASNTKLSTPLRVKNYVDYVILTSFWDWSDWDVTITTTVTLTRDMYYNNLTITSPWVLNPDWYRVYVKNTLSWNWTIRRNWNTWWAWQLASGWTWASALNAWSLNAEVWGANGWYIWVWATWGSSNPSYTAINWANWWAWWPYWAWWGWTSTRWALYNTYNKFSNLLMSLNPASFTINTTQYKTASWSGWGWGWYVSWYGWWGWGWNWGLIWIASRIINFTWTMESLGWTWWAGFQWAYSWWSAWGGGWWQGWVIYLIASTFTSIWTQNLTGWAWWIAWNTWAPAWSAWSTWNSWVTIQITV